MIATTNADFEGLRLSGRILAEVLIALKDRAQVGVSLLDLDLYARQLLLVAGARSAFLGYVPEWSGKSYPAAICTSINEEIVHGIPRKRKLSGGDVLKIDLGVEYDGYITDGALTVCVGEPKDDRVLRLLKTTYHALQAGVAAVRPGARVGDIGSAVSSVVTLANLKVFKNLTGHGVGRKLHEEPTIWNFGNKGQGVVLRPGLVIALEPMVSLGSDEIIDAPYQAFSTKDGSLAAHFEKTVLVTEEGCEVLTPFLYST